MTINLRQAKPLCTAGELELVRLSLMRTAPKLTPAQLRQKVKMARRLRDKYRSLAERQRREARGKQEPRGARPAAGNERTQLKVQLFDETLTRFEQKLDQATAGAAVAPAKKKAAKKTATRANATAKPRAVAKTPTASKSAARKVTKKAAGKAAVKKKGGKKTRKRRVGGAR